jgi:spore coat polysaccharide biosynthesis protein SpsF
MRTVAIIQARTGSTRLPGKILEDLAGEPMLARVVNRVGRARTLDAVAVATTVASTDDRVVRLCEARGWSVFRGSEEDVLDRYYHAALELKADVVVRITSDCPLIDPDIIDRIVGEFLALRPDVDYVSNGLERTFPRGLGVEAMSFDALERAWREDSNPAWREHVTQYIVRNPNAFRCANVANDEDRSYMRWTVDTIEDLTLVRRIYDSFRDDTFGWRDVLHLVESHPDWLEVNKHIQQKTVP